MRLVWRKRFLDIILPTREAVMKDFREAEGEMGVYQGERRVMEVDACEVQLRRMRI